MRRTCGTRRGTTCVNLSTNCGLCDSINIVCCNIITIIRISKFENLIGGDFCRRCVICTQKTARLACFARVRQQMAKNKKGTNTKSTQGQGGSGKQGSKKSGGTAPIEEVRFMPGENQAENCQKLIDHLTDKVLGERQDTQENV